MKRFFLTLLFCSIAVPCLALTPLTDANLTAAMNYGISSRQDGLTLEKFLEPWLIRETLLQNPYRRQENIVVYSPYLLAAIHSRNMIEGKEMPKPEELRNAIKEYEGILLVGVVLNTPAAIKQEDFTICLSQGKTQLAPYAVTLLNAEVIPARQAERMQNSKTPAIKSAAGKLNKAPAGKEVTPKTGTEKVWRIRLQCYFDEEEFQPGEKYSVMISDVRCGMRQFEVDPASFR